MKINMSLNALIIALLWIIVAILNIGMTIIVLSNKRNMISYMNNGIKKNISLSFISKFDEIKLYEFLTSKSINVTT